MVEKVTDTREYLSWERGLAEHRPWGQGRTDFKYCLNRGSGVYKALCWMQSMDSLYVRYSWGGVHVLVAAIW